MMIMTSMVAMRTRTLDSTARRSVLRVPTERRTFQHIHMAMDFADPHRPTTMLAQVADATHGWVGWPSSVNDGSDISFLPPLPMLTTPVKITYDKSSKGVCKALEFRDCTFAGAESFTIHNSLMQCVTFDKCHFEDLKFFNVVFTEHRIEGSTYVKIVVFEH